MGALTCLEVAARRLNLIVDAHKQGSAPPHVNAKCLTPLAETDEILAQGLRAHLSRPAREDWEEMQSAKNADAAAAMTDLMTYDDGGGNDGKQGGGVGKGQGKKSRSSRKVGARPLRSNANPAREKIPRAGRQQDPVQPHFRNVTSSLVLVARLRQG